MPVHQPRPRILVVDDEPEVLRSIHDLLRLEYEIVTTTSGASAIELLASSTGGFQAILTDQRMPGMTGVEVLQKAQEIRPETTRLLFTAYTDIRTVVDAINRGQVFRYIAKPWEPEELEAAVRQAVEHHNLIVEKNRLLIELQATNTKLLEANRLKAAFLEVASHELNTPVTVVLGLADLWKMSVGETATGPERQWVERIHAAAQRLAKTVHRMLKLLHQGQFTQSLELASIEVEPLIRQTVVELSPYLEARRQTVSIAVEPELGPILADASKVTDILINLLANAIKFSPDEGTIRISANRDQDDPDSVRLAVADEGLGIDPAELHLIFEPFFTGFDTLHHSSGEYQFGKRGIGLGLCLVKTFAELHGGRVEVQSIPTRGSTFSVILPRNPTTRSKTAPCLHSGDDVDSPGSGPSTTLAGPSLSMSSPPGSGDVPPPAPPVKPVSPPTTESQPSSSGDGSPEARLSM